jgi:hypothetical protein
MQSFKCDKHEGNQQKIIIDIVLQCRHWLTNKYHIHQIIRNEK